MGPVQRGEQIFPLASLEGFCEVMVAFGHTLQRARLKAGRGKRVGDRRKSMRRVSKLLHLPAITTETGTCGWHQLTA